MWHKNSYRRIFMDMHLSDDNPEYLSKLDVDKLVESLSIAGATNVAVKAKSHVGVHYWPGKYGRMHKTLEKRGLDYVGQMVEKCHKKGIGVMVYYSQIHDNYAYETYPEWRMVNPEGKSSRELGERYGWVCPNNTEYRKYVKEILEELNELYDFEGMFLDMPYWPMVCYCDDCKKRFKSETGYDIPINLEWDDPVSIEFVHRRQRWMEEFMLENTRVVKAIKPHVTIEHNVSTLGHDWQLGGSEGGIDACDYAGGDFYGGFMQQSFICKYYNNITPNKPFCYHTSRCDDRLTLHTVTRSAEQLTIYGICSIMHNGAFNICDAMNPDGTITHAIYRNELRNAFKAVEGYEKYVSGNICANIAILYDNELKVNDNYIQSPLNVAEIMREKNIAFDVIGNRNIKGLKTPILSINDVFGLTDTDAVNIREYVEKGGKLFITGKIGHPDVEKLVGIKVKGKSDYMHPYLVPTDIGEEYFVGFSKESPYPVNRFAWESDVVADNAEILATLTYPYTKPGDYEFAAIHSNPPGIHTDMPAVIRRKVGKGEVMWVAAPLEMMSATYCRQTIEALIRSMIEEDVFIGNAPYFVEILTWEKDGHRYLGIINQQEKMPPYPISDIWVKLPGKYPDAKSLCPDVKEPTVEICNEFTTLKTDKLNLFQIYQLD